jgi:DNA repair exonuclease SbcCD nuclease subunit
VLAGAEVPIVLLPGNHDPIMPDCLFRRAGLDAIDNVFVFGVDGRDCVRFPELDVEIVGFPHLGTDDSVPVGVPRPRELHWQVVMAHGHYVSPAEWQAQSYRSWLIADEHIASTGADYLALGHWDRAAQVGDGSVPAYYSGSPDWAETINLIRLHRRSGILIALAPMN